MTKDYPWGKGTPKWVRDATLNDSDKSFTVPTGKIWQLNNIMAALSTTATVGNRTLSVVVTDGTNQIYRLIAPSNVAASTTKTYHFGQYGYESTASDLAILSQLDPNLILPSGYVIRIWDINAIDAAADDLTIVLQYVEYDA